MKKKRLTIGIQVAVLVVGGALISLAALSYILIQMQSGYAFNQFMERHERLTNLMANEMAKQGTLKKHACKTPDTHGPSNPWYFLGIFQETSHFFW